MSDIEDQVREFYERFGWVVKDGKTGEDLSFRQFSAAYAWYERKATERTVAQFARLGGKLLVAGGGDLPESHLRIANGFASVSCLDIARRALEISRGKLGDQATYLQASILQMPVPAGTFDAVLCAHVLYHIDLTLQEAAVRQLIRVVREGGRVVIIYSNPESPFVNLATQAAIVRLRARRLGALFRFARRVDEDVRDEKVRNAAQDAPKLYIARHPLRWWWRFERDCEIHLVPWNVISAWQERALFRANWLAGLFYRGAFVFENALPSLAVRWWQYPIIVLDKRPSSPARRVSGTPESAG